MTEAVKDGGNITPPPPPPPPPGVGSSRNRTLLDIIKEEDKEGNKDKKTWKTFRDKLRLKRTGSAWISSVHIPASDIHIPPRNNHRKPHHRSGRHASSHQSDSSAATTTTHESTHHQHHQSFPMSHPTAQPGRPLFTRGASMRVASSKQPEPAGMEESADISMPGEGLPSGPVRQQSVSTVIGEVDEETDKKRRPVVTLPEERSLSAREAVAAQEASEAEAAAAAENEMEEESAAPVMSLMDLLEETDRQMGLTGSRYMTDMDEEEYDEEYEEEEEVAGEDEVGNIGEYGDGESACCICMVKISGVSSGPCGHTLCRLCSRELMVQKGYCPVCCKYVLEFLDIF